MQRRSTDHFPPFDRVRFRKQFLHRYVAPARVGNVFESVGKRQLDRFDVQMVGIRRFLPFELHSLQDVQRQQRYQPMAVGRQFPYLVTPVVDTDWFYPFRSIAGQVACPQTAAVMTGKRIDTPGEFPLIKVLAITVGQSAQSMRVGR